MDKINNKKIRDSMVAVIIFAIAGLGSYIMNFLGIDKESIIMIFLLGVLFTTVLTNNYIWGIIVSVLSLMLVNFLYTEPRFTFVISDTSDIVLLIFFLVTAITSGRITSKLQQQIIISNKNERTSVILYNIAAEFLSINGASNMISKAKELIREYTGYDANIEIYSKKRGYLDEISDTLNTVDFEIKTKTSVLGIIKINSSDRIKDRQNNLIIDSIATQLGIALDRDQLHSERENIRIAMEREKLKATLLRSVSHDLRSPLTALSGAGNVLADKYDTLSDQERKQLATDISEEILWLINLVENILSMTKINDSKFELNKKEELIDDVVSEAVSHTKRLIKGRNFKVILPDDMISICIDGKLIVQVIINLIENAINHTSEKSDIILEVEKGEKEIIVSIKDTGEGIPEELVERIFDRFVTTEKSVIDGKKGIGLGLTICRAIVQAHGGSIYYLPNDPQGSIFTFSLPLEV